MSAEWVSVIIQGLLALGVAAAFYVNVTAQQKASTAQQKAVDEAAKVEKAAASALDNAVSRLYGVINPLGNRVERIETTLENIPHAKDVHNIAIRCEELVGEMKRLSAEMKGVAESSKNNQDTLRRVEGYIMDTERDKRR